ncbi:glycoside hydrolase family 108 protein [Chroococcidiopsis sp.]|uniref:glycoside hydrolase family 108 protein n=1 Tax=Chroococcidiopsis sp. TaxID=3088168 RepID=UPI003F40013E
MSTDNFNRALQFTLDWEGGFSNHPNDTGGATNFGITQATYDRYRKNRQLPKHSVKLIRRHEATDIYHAYYWVEGGCDKLPDKWALCHFDWCVNHGTGGATCTLQRTVGATPDGIWGAKTTAAVAQAIEQKGERTCVAMYCNLREAWYRREAERNPSQRVFLKGWLNRLAGLRQHLEVA